MTARPAGFALLVLLQLASAHLEAGEIAGIPSQAPPFLQRDFEINFSNDFLGRGGSVDDFRTQQINVTGRFSEKWLALIDHSILTLGSADPPGRLDQMSLSLGYEAIYQASETRINKVIFGGGIRSVGDFAGARMQNGFHQLIDSEIQTMDYVATDRNDATLWIDAEHYRLFHESATDGLFGGWRTGYWLRGSTLLTTDGQWDNALGAYAVSSRNSIDVWLGLRRDWRSGYDRDRVQAATAAAESEMAVVLGVRFGALILETVQQPNGDASYGQLKFFATGKQAFPRHSAWPRIGLELSFFLPDVTVELASRFRHRFLTENNSSWNESVVVDAKFGTPQYGSDPSVFTDSKQLTLGLEWERQVAPGIDWISFYTGLSGGYRIEQLLGEGVLAGESSSSAGRAVLNVDSGLRFNAASLSDSWTYRLQLGIGAWIPLNDAHVQLANDTYRIQKSALGFSLGMTFDYQ